MSIKKITFKEKIEIFSSLIMIFGAIFAIWQYVDMLHQDRVKETLNYEKRLNEGEFFKSKIKIEKAWFAHEEFFEQLKRSKIKSKKDKEKILEKISNTIIEKNKLQSHIDTLCDFYGSLSICIKENICDKKTAISFFKPYATKFYNLHRFYILQRENYIKDYAKGLKYIVNDLDKKEKL